MIWFRRRPIFRRLLVTFGLVVVFILGRSLPLPGVSIGDYLNLNPYLDTAVSLTGGSLSQIGLFSLGLGPMMYASLLAQLFSLGKRQRILPPKLLAYRKNLLMLLIAAIQGLSLALNLTYHQDGELLMKLFRVTAVLVAGSFVLMWLGNLNATYGIGGHMAIMLASILLGQMPTVPFLVDLWQGRQAWLVMTFSCWTLITIFLTVYFEKAEYRIPLQRLAIHNRYAKDAYLPIKVNITGGMPIMYTYSLLALPQYLLLLLAYAVPDIEQVRGWSSYFTLTTGIGVAIYVIVLIALTLAMSFLSVDVVSLADDLRRAGDYIPYIPTGEPTKRYLAKYVRFFAFFNASYLVLLSGLPLLLSLFVVEARPLTGLTGVLMMTGGLLMTILEELSVMNLRKRYVSLFD